MGEIPKKYEVLILAFSVVATILSFYIAYEQSISRSVETGFWVYIALVGVDSVQTQVNKLRNLPTSKMDVEIRINRE